MLRRLLPLGVTLLLVACRGGQRPANPAPDQRAPQTVKTPPPRPDLGGTPDAGRPAPLVLRRLTVTRGLQGAEIRETNEKRPYWGKVSTRSWSVRGEAREHTRVVQIRLGRRSPRSLAGYLRRWRANHGCTAKKTRDLPLTRHGGLTPPQLTFEGVCKGGDAYIIRVLLLGDTAYRLHVDTFDHGGLARLRARFLELLSSVELTRPPGRRSVDGVKRQLKSPVSDESTKKIIEH